jgi:hypothetical protein
VRRPATLQRTQSERHIACWQVRTQHGPFGARGPPGPELSCSSRRGQAETGLRIIGRAHPAPAFLLVRCWNFFPFAAREIVEYRATGHDGALCFFLLSVGPLPFFWVTICGGWHGICYKSPNSPSPGSRWGHAGLHFCLRKVRHTSTWSHSIRLTPVDVRMVFGLLWQALSGMHSLSGDLEHCRLFRMCRLKMPCGRAMAEKNDLYISHRGAQNCELIARNSWSDVT